MPCHKENFVGKGDVSERACNLSGVLLVRKGLGLTSGVIGWLSSEGSSVIILRLRREGMRRKKKPVFYLKFIFSMDFLCDNGDATRKGF